MTSAHLGCSPLHHHPHVGDDATWGPVSKCRPFDWTIRFESIVLSLIPSALLIAAALAILALVCRRHLPWVSPAKKTSSHDRTRLNTKLLVATLSCYWLINIVSIAVTVTPSRQAQATLLLPSAILQLVSATALALLLVAQVRLAARAPSTGHWIASLASFYLFCVVLFDSARLRTATSTPLLSSSTTAPGYLAVFALRLALQVVLLTLVASATAPSPSIFSPHSRSPFPSAQPSILQRLLFLHLVPTLWRGRSSPIEVHEIHLPNATSRTLSQRLYHAWTQTQTRSRSHSRSRPALHSHTKGTTQEKPSAFAAEPQQYHLHTFGPFVSAQQEQHNHHHRIKGMHLLASTFRASPGVFLKPVLPKAFFTLATILKPLLVESTLSFVNSYGGDDGATPQPPSHGYGLVGAFALVYLISAFSQGQYLCAVYDANCTVRGAFVQSIYLKSLTLSAETILRDDAKSATALMSVDVERIVTALDAIHEFWSALVIIPVAAYLLYAQIGLAFVATLVTVLGVIFALPLIAGNIKQRQAAWSAQTDRRVTLITSVLLNIRAVKMLAYEHVMAQRLIRHRAAEVDALRRYCLGLIRVSCLGVFSSEIILFATIATFAIISALSGTNDFNSTNIFTTITILAIVDSPLFAVSQRYAILMSAFSSIQRIDEYLSEAESPRQKNAEQQQSHSTETPEQRRHPMVDDKTIVALTHASFTWYRSPSDQAHGEKSSVLDQITMHVQRGERVGVIGPLSSGKSSLLCALLGELYLVSGKAILPMLHQQVAYVSQVPWVSDALTIRENVLLGDDLDDARFKSSIRTCALDIDLEQLPLGADTLGSSLSGGQRQRLALCRAIYRNADVYVLDDVFSAIDAHSVSTMLDRLFGEDGVLRLKTVIMTSNSPRVLSQCERLYSLSISGRISEVAIGENAFGKAELEALITDNADAIRPDQVLRDLSSVKPTTDLTITSEHIPNDTVQVKESVDEKRADEEDVFQGRISLDVYRAWMQGAGYWTILAYFTSLFISNGLSYGEQYFLQGWSGEHRTSNELRRSLGCGLGVLVAMQLIRMLTYGLASFLLLTLAVPRVARKLHQDELMGVLRRRYTYFLRHPPGMLVNRFTQDLFVLDFEFTRAFMNLLFFAQDIAIALITMVIPAPYLLIVIAGGGAIYVIIYRLYTPNSRHLRRLEMATKSPLHTHFSSSTNVGGLLSIRASRQEESLARINARLLDRSQKPYYLLWQVRAWLQTSLHTLAAVLNTMLVLVAVLMRHSPSVTTLGIALVSATSIANMLNFLMVSITEAEIASVALERIQDLATLPSDPLLIEDISPPGSQRTASSISPVMHSSAAELDRHRDSTASAAADEQVVLGMNSWNIQAGIDLQNVSARYTNDDALVLHNLSFVVPKGERLGVCGRSGSGKSTFVLVLLGMLSPTTGVVRINGKDTTKLTPYELRSRTSVVPQDPLVLPVSVRDNLDPDGQLGRTDNEMWDALCRSGLDELVAGKEQRLDHVLNPDTMSAGQRQLLCVARSILRRSDLIVLDEATSTMDAETDARVQKLLQEETLRSEVRPTVVSVAHRIASIIDYDRILVLDHGRVAEFDTPSKLLANKDGHFYALAAEQGCVHI